MRLPHSFIKVDQFRPEERVTHFLLSHFHTDHTVGLCNDWDAGVLCCTAVTRALVLSTFRIDRRRIVTVTLDDDEPLRLEHAVEKATAEVYAINANHIVGSCMFIVKYEAVGTVLYTGDFKYDATAAMADNALRYGPIDHLFVDTTWLHLAKDKFMSRGELHSAFAALRVYCERLSAQHVQPPVAGGSVTVPYAVRVYLHNQFGKETLVAEMAMTLRADIFVDRRRLDMLRAAALVDADVAVALRYFHPEEQLHDYLRQRRLDADHCAAPLWWEAAVDDAGIPVTRPVIHIVSSRKLLTDDALADASQLMGAPYVGVLMSGWARLHHRATDTNRVWHLPYTLHSTAAEIEEFVRLIRPRSVLPLGSRPGRAAGIAAALGRYLLRPFRNDLAQLSGLASAVLRVTAARIAAGTVGGLPSKRSMSADTVPTVGQRRRTQPRCTEGDVAPLVPTTGEASPIPSDDDDGDAPAERETALSVAPSTPSCRTVAAPALVAWPHRMHLSAYDNRARAAFRFDTVFASTASGCTGVRLAHEAKPGASVASVSDLIDLAAWDSPCDSSN